MKRVLVCIVAGAFWCSVASAETADPSATDVANWDPREAAGIPVFLNKTHHEDAVIRSLYAHKDVFLGDALDNIRLLPLAHKSLPGEGDAPELDVQLDPEAGVLHLREHGSGLTREELENMGGIALSGIKPFLEQRQEGGGASPVGNGSTGFHSACLLADRVEVVSKHDGDTQYIWSSDTGGSPTVVEDTENELGRGTLVKVHLKPKALANADGAKLEELLAVYHDLLEVPGLEACTPSLDTMYNSDQAAIAYK